jgi:hypothetical protein
VTVKPTPDLGKRGKAFWDLIASAYDLAPSEQELLLETCRTLDLVERLEERLDGGTDTRTAAELRQQRLALGRLLSQLSIPQDTLESPQTIRARKAAQSRWAGHTKREKKGRTA